jgi:hypothetical protein
MWSQRKLCMQATEFPLAAWHLEAACVSGLVGADLDRSVSIPGTTA